MNWNCRKKISAFSWVVVSLAVGVLSANAFDNEIPPEIREDIKKLLEVKMRAMSTPLSGMRSINGELGRQAEVLMDRIGEAAAQSDLGSVEGDRLEMEGRVIAWALDRRARSRDYSTFAQTYVNRPLTEADWAKYLRASRSQWAESDPRHNDPIDTRIQPHRVVPLPVRQELLEEENRLMFEYFFFVPPTGSAFHDDLWRHELAEALVALEHYSRSTPMMERDAAMAVRAGVLKEGVLQNLEATRFFVAAQSERSFDALAELWAVPSARLVIPWSFKHSFSGDQPVRSYPARKDAYEAWQQLAGEDHDTAEARAFAEWLRSVPPPEPPPPPGKHNPDDPFSSAE